MKKVLLWLGILALLLGILFIGQGTGYFPYASRPRPRR